MNKKAFVNTVANDLPNIAVAGIVVYDNHCLFLKRNNPPLNWAPPAGRLRENEPPSEGVVREIKEETGLDATALMCVETWIGKPVDKQVVSSTYVCQTTSNEVFLSKEHSDYRWIHIDELQNSNIETDFNIKEWPAFIAAAKTYSSFKLSISSGGTE